MHELRGELVFVFFALPLQLFVGPSVHAFGLVWKQIIKIANITQTLANHACPCRRLIARLLVLTVLGKVLAFSAAQMELLQGRSR